MTTTPNIQIASGVNLNWNNDTSLIYVALGGLGLTPITATEEAVFQVYGTKSAGGDKNSEIQIYGVTGAAGEFLQISGTISSNFIIEPRVVGAGVYEPLLFLNSATEAMRITIDPFVQFAADLTMSTDNARNIGSNTNRIKTVNSNFFYVYGASGDSAPTTELTSQALYFGPGGSTGIDVEIGRQTVGGIFIQPYPVSTTQLGLLSLYAGGSGHAQMNLYDVYTDTQPQAQLLTTGVGGGELNLGAGGSTAPTVTLQYGGAAGTLYVTTGASTHGAGITVFGTNPGAGNSNANLILYSIPGGTNYEFLQINARQATSYDISAFAGGSGALRPINFLTSTVFSPGTFAFGGYGADIITSAAKGDIWYYNGSNLVNLPISATSTNILGISSGVPAWVAPSSGGPTTYRQGGNQSSSGASVASTYLTFSALANTVYWIEADLFAGAPATAAGWR